jgi:hypothetical protein
MKQLRSLRESYALEKRYVRRTVSLSRRGPEFPARDAAGAFLYAARGERHHELAKPCETGFSGSDRAYGGSGAGASLLG